MHVCSVSLHFVQVMVCVWRHTPSPSRPQAHGCHRASWMSSLRRLTQKKRNRKFTHFHLCFLSERDFDVCESGPGQGAEAWLERWGLMNRSTTVACCVCLPFHPAAWIVEVGEHSSWPRRWEAWAHTLKNDMMAHTLHSVPKKCPNKAVIVNTRHERIKGPTKKK